MVMKQNRDEYKQFTKHWHDTPKKMCIPNRKRREKSNCTKVLIQKDHGIERKPKKRREKTEPNIFSSVDFLRKQFTLATFDNSYARYLSLSLVCVLQNVSTENENINSCFMRYFLIGEKKIGTNIRQNTCMPHSSKMFYTEDGIFNNHSKTWLCCHLSVSAGFCVAVCCFVATFDCVNLI